MRLPRRKPAPRDPRVDPARQALAVAVGNAQLPEVIIEIDHLTRFSWTLLGRPARSESELVTLCHRALEKLVDLAHRHGVELRQSYRRLGQRIARDRQGCVVRFGPADRLLLSAPPG